MVSTRLMTISTGPCSTEDLISPAVTHSRNGTSMAASSSSIITQPEDLLHQINLLDLPVEILDKTFSYVGYKKTAQMRVVSRQMNAVCSGILNSTFQRLLNFLLNRLETVKNMMPRRESARRYHPYACEFDIVETCYMRLSLLQMTFGKHIERKHCCFFPGGILDEVYSILNFIRTTPNLSRPFKVTDELFDLSTMAMEYFKDHIEPNLPEIGYFSKPKLFMLESNLTSKPPLSVRESSTSSSSSSPPQTNMVLRKGIRKIKQGMKRYNNQLSVLRNELRNCKRKANEQSKQISEQQKLLSEQQKQTLEYANRLDENDKKNEEMSRKFSTLLQELNKCKTELQYWRSKSPATPICTSCGQAITVTPDELVALVNQGVKPGDINLESKEDDGSGVGNGFGNGDVGHVHHHHHIVEVEVQNLLNDEGLVSFDKNTHILANNDLVDSFKSPNSPPIIVSSETVSVIQSIVAGSTPSTSLSPIAATLCSKRKAYDEVATTAVIVGPSETTGPSKKLRRVQSKAGSGGSGGRCHNISSSSVLTTGGLNGSSTVGSIKGRK